MLLRPIIPLLTLLSVCEALGASLFAQTNSPSAVERPGWQLTWHDEFDGTAIDPQKWAVYEPGKRESAIISADSATLDGQGHLLLTTREVDGVIHSGMISTRKKFAQTFGRWEARIRFEEKGGHHGSFWMQPERDNREDTLNPHRTGAEIDVVEWFGASYLEKGGNGTACNVYWKKAGKPADWKGAWLNRVGLKYDTRPILGAEGRACDDFHTYAVEWTPDEYVFFFDDQEVFRTREGVSHQPEYAILSLLAADWELGRLDRTALPESMIVDYVRVYQRGSGPQ